MRLSDEDERAGEATDKWEEEQVGQFSVCGLHYWGVAKSDKHSHYKSCQDNTHHCTYGQSYPEGFCPGKKLNFLQEAQRVVPTGPGIIWTLGANAGICTNNKIICIRTAKWNISRQSECVVSKYLYGCCTLRLSTRCIQNSRWAYCLLSPFLCQVHSPHCN